MTAPAAVAATQADAQAAPAFPSDLHGRSYVCVICRKDLSRSKLPARITHVKDCAKKRGITLRHMEDITNEQKKRPPAERPATTSKKETRSKFFAAGTSSDGKEDAAPKAKSKAAAKRTAAPELSIEEAQVMSIAKIAAIKEANKVAAERRAVEAEAPLLRLAPAEAVQRVFSTSHSYDADIVTPTPTLAPSVLQAAGRSRLSLLELSAGKITSKPVAAPVPVAPPAAPVTVSIATTTTTAVAPSVFIPAAAMGLVPEAKEEKAKDRAPAPRINELMEDEPLQPSPTERAHSTEAKAGAALKLVTNAPPPVAAATVVASTAAALAVEVTEKQTIEMTETKTTTITSTTTATKQAEDPAAVAKSTVSEAENKNNESLPEAPYSPLPVLNDSYGNYGLDPGPSSDESAEVEPKQLLEGLPSSPHSQPPARASQPVAQAIPDANAHQVYLNRCAEIREIYAEKLNQLKTWYYAEIGRAAIERDKAFLVPPEQLPPVAAVQQLPSASPRHTPPVMPGPLVRGNSSSVAPAPAAAVASSSQPAPSSGSAAPQEDLQALFEVLTPSAFLPPLPAPSSQPSASTSKTSEPVAIASLPKAQPSKKSKPSKAPASSVSASAPAVVPGADRMPDYSIWTTEALERECSNYGLKQKMPTAQMVAHLTKIWTWVNTPHSPAPVLPFPSKAANAAAAKEVNEEEQKLDEKISTALKALPMWKEILQYKVIDVKELKKQLIAAGVKVTKPVLAAYCDRQGVQYIGMSKRKPGTYF